MIETTTSTSVPTAADLELMHEAYRNGGRERLLAPHIIYPVAECPHDGCDCGLHAIDFRPGDHGRSVHDPLVRAWWNDTGFVGRCPLCRGWIHFTIRAKSAIGPEEAAGLPHLPDDWQDKATIL